MRGGISFPQELGRGEVGSSPTEVASEEWDQVPGVSSSMTPDDNTDQSINTDSGCSRTADPDMALGHSTGRDLAWPEVAAWATHISLFLIAITSSAPFLSAMHGSLRFSFSPIATADMFVVTAPAQQACDWLLRAGPSRFNF